MHQQSAATWWERKLPLNEDAIATSTLVSGSPTHLLLEVTFMAVEAPSPTSPDCTGQDSACSTEAARAHCPTHLPELVGKVPEKSWCPAKVFRVTDVNRDHQQDSPAMTWERILIATVWRPSGGGNSEGRDPYGLRRGREEKGAPQETPWLCSSPEQSAMFASSKCSHTHFAFNL